MTTIDQIYSAVLTLPVGDRLKLVERVVHGVLETTGQHAPGEDSLLGLFAAEPDLIDEVCRTALEERSSRPLRASDG